MAGRRVQVPLATAALALLVLGFLYCRTPPLGNSLAPTPPRIPVQAVFSTAGPADPRGETPIATVATPSRMAPMAVSTRAAQQNPPTEAASAGAAGCSNLLGGPPIQLKILTYNRAESLNRLLQSLLKADYLGDSVPLQFFIDMASGPTDAKQQAVVQLAKNFAWPYGPKTLHEAGRRYKLAGQWLRCWDPQSDDERAFILEDDMTVAPIFYHWLKKAHSFYASVPQMVGISLQAQSFKVRPSGSGSYPINNGNKPYLYQLPGSWGFSPVARHWRAFVAWHRTHSVDPSFHPYVDGLVTTTWWKQFEQTNKTDSMWTQWLIRYISDNNLATLYPNAPGNKLLITHWQEAGEHYSAQQAEAYKRNPAQLATAWEPPLSQLPVGVDVYNFGYEKTGTAMSTCTAAEGS